MKTNVDITKIFSKHLFWDMDYSKLNLKIDIEIIIPRAMYPTSKDTFDQDIEKLKQFYTKDQIIDYLKDT